MKIIIKRRKIIFLIVVSLFVWGISSCGSSSGSSDSDDTSDTSALTAAGYCGVCHATQYDTYIESGHAFKLNAVSTSAPTYPSFVPSVFDETNLTSPPSIFTGGWSDVAYVIGGYGWKARFIDSNGYILTSGDNGSDEAQYNLDRTDIATGATAETTTYSGATSYPSKIYDCGYCHTTGWDSTGQQGNLAGMSGSWTYEGITCSRCHGSDTGGGSGHNTVSMGADGPSISDIEGVAVTNNFANLDSDSPMNSVCASCHVRVTGTDTPTIEPAIVSVGDGFIQHRGQAQELYVGQHGIRAYGCVDCHDPHASTRYDEDAAGEGINSFYIIDGACTQYCHNLVRVASIYGALHTCVDCHMPYIVKSARSFSVGNKTVSGVTALGIPTEGHVRGDMRSHIFSLSSTSDETFLAANIDETENDNRVKIPVNFSCMTCHGTGGASGPTTAEEAATILSNDDIHPPSTSTD